MANIRSAEKAHRGSLKKAVFNARRKRSLRDTVKDTMAAVTAKQGKEAAALLSKAYQAIDKGVKRGIIKMNTGSRMKARLAAKVKTLA